MLNPHPATPSFEQATAAAGVLVPNEALGASPGYLPFKADVRRPGRALPAGACDCHFHIFEATPQGGPAYPFD